MPPYFLKHVSNGGCSHCWEKPFVATFISSRDIRGITRPPSFSVYGTPAIGTIPPTRRRITRPAQVPVRINHGDLTALLYLQGYAQADFVG